MRESKNPSLVGLSGIVAHETENAFKVVTIRDQLKRTSSFSEIFVSEMLTLQIRSNTKAEFYLHFLSPSLCEGITLIDGPVATERPNVCK